MNIRIKIYAQVESQDDPVGQAEFIQAGPLSMCTNGKDYMEPGTTLTSICLTVTTLASSYGSEFYNTIGHIIHPADHILIIDGKVIRQFEHLGGKTSTFSQKKLSDYKIKEGDTIHSIRVQDTISFGHVKVGRILDSEDLFIITVEGQVITCLDTFHNWIKIKEEMEHNSPEDDYCKQTFLDPRDVWKKFMVWYVKLSKYQPDNQELLQNVLTEMENY